MKLISNLKNKNKMRIENTPMIEINTLAIILFINIIFTGYLLIVNNKNSKTIKDLLDFKNKFYEKNYSFKYDIPDNDKELIGLHPPEIKFDKIKEGMKNLKIFTSLMDLINQLENKLIYLEKEINVTKITSFYTSRKLFLNEKNITYDETNLTQLHEIVSWITIHKSTQLKGIASDKYLACKYVKLKLGKDLCQQRIAVYDKFEDLTYDKLSKYGDIVLKVSNVCWNTVLISKNFSRMKFEKALKKLKKSLEFSHGLVEAQFFHLYSKRRIIVEKQFSPSKDLYEFKFFIVNRKIKFLYLMCTLSKKLRILIYDTNYNFLFMEKSIKDNPIDIKSIFKKELLDQLKEYAIKLSEDFPDFIRVDLYAFHDQIYLSELTFASYSGRPMYPDENFVKESAKNFSTIKYDY